MKSIICFLLMSLFSISSYSQSLDQVLNDVANDLASKTSKKNKVKLALADFVNENGKTDASTNYLHQQIEMNLINADNLQVMDRKHIADLLKEHRLQSSGLIDESTAKSAISFIKVDGWVLGEVTNIGSQFRIKLKVIDISTSQIFAVSTSGLIDGIELRKIMEPKACNICAGSGTQKSYITCEACEGKGGAPCYSCGGVGNPYNGLTGRKQACEVCSGKGKINCTICAGTGQKVALKTCAKCKGTGKLL
ncbi:MAG: hypothetical protein ABIM99_06335 [Candidatus Dojkabacteria bacterium]